MVAAIVVGVGVWVVMVGVDIASEAADRHANPDAYRTEGGE